MSLISRIREWAFIASMTLVIWLALDFLFGAELLRRLFSERISIERAYRIENPVYHHDLIADYDGLGQWGGIIYRVCTDSNGFKTSCEKKSSQEKNFDIVFIGDSFTEGVGLPYEETFVGRIAHARPDWKVANMAVVSYAPSIYLPKIKKYLEDGFKFKELVVFVDVGDIQDDAIIYKYSDGVVTRRQSLTTAQRSGNILYFLFPLTASTFFVPYALNPGPPPETIHFLSPHFPRSGWTLNEEIGGFGEMGVNGAIARSLELMTQLHDLVTQHGIRLSVGVYPWPGQILHDRSDSRHVKIWREFCEARCARFYDSFPAFFAYAGRVGKQVAVEQLYIKGDVHHSAEGARLIAEDFLAKHRPIE
jgi:hypothetical protein